MIWLVVLGVVIAFIWLRSASSASKRRNAKTGAPTISRSKQMDQYAAARGAARRAQRQTKRADKAQAEQDRRDANRYLAQLGKEQDAGGEEAAGLDE